MDLQCNKDDGSTINRVELPNPCFFAHSADPVATRWAKPSKFEHTNLKFLKTYIYTVHAKEILIPSLKCRLPCFSVKYANTFRILNLSQRERTGSVGEPLTDCVQEWAVQKTVMRRWGYLDDAQSVDCDCGEPQTMAHLLSCRLLDEACTADDLATVTERAKACAASGRKL